MIPYRRSAIFSHWKQLGRVCTLNRFAPFSTRIPSHIICENHYRLVNRGELGRRGYATETLGNLSSFLWSVLAPLCNVKGRVRKPKILTSTRSWSPTGDSLTCLIEHERLANFWQRRDCLSSYQDCEEAWYQDGRSV